MIDIRQARDIVSESLAAQPIHAELLLDSTLRGLPSETNAPELQKFRDALETLRAAFQESTPAGSGATDDAPAAPDSLSAEDVRRQEARERLAQVVEKLRTMEGEVARLGVSLEYSMARVRRQAPRSPSGKPALPPTLAQLRSVVP